MLTLCKRVAVLLTAVILFAAVGVASADFYPDGLSQSDIISGIAAGSDAGSCCWLVRDGVAFVSVPPEADTLVVSLFQPTYALDHGRTRGFDITLADARSSRCCFGPGMVELSVHVPPNLRSKRVLLTIVPSSTFVPAAVGIGPDGRHLSALLRSVRFLDLAAGDSASMPARQQHSAYRTAAIAGLTLALILSFLLAWRRPGYAAISLVAADPFALYFFSHGTSITLSKVALLGSAAGLLFALSRMQKPGSAFAVLAFAQTAFILSMVISSIDAVSHAAAIRETLKMLQYFATFVVAYAAFRLGPDESALSRAVAIVNLTVAAVALAQLFTGVHEYGTFLGHVVPRIAGPIEGPNQLAGFLGITAPLLLAWICANPRRPLLWSSLVLTMLALPLTFSRGGEGAAFIGCGLVAALWFAPNRSKVIGAVSGAIFAAVLLVAFAQFLGAANLAFVFGSGQSGTGLGTRAELWRGAFLIWREHWILGVGPGNFELLVHRFAPGVRTHANSVYFNTLAEQGIVGIGALALLLVAMIRPLTGNRRTPLILGTLGAVTAMCFHQVADTIWIYPKVGVLFFALLGIAAAKVDSPQRGPSLS